MSAIRIPPERLAEEVASFQERLASGVAGLSRMGEIDTGATPREVIHAEDKLRLCRFHLPEKEPPAGPPLVIVYALVNRPYMTDLQPDRSLVRGLLAAGLDVYLIDWGYPDHADRYLTLSDYIDGYLDRCVSAVCRLRDVERVNVLGICQGGTMSLCYAALNPARVAALVTMVTPVDFHTPDNLLSRWVREIDVDLLVETLGNVPGELLNWTFLSLKPFQLGGRKYVDMVDLIDDPERMRNFLRMEKWIFDSPDQAGEAFREFVTGFFQQNRLIAGGFRLGAREVSLEAVTMPVLNVFALQDHVVPPDSSRALAGRVGTGDYTEQAFRGGHIGIYVSARASREVPPAIGEWVSARWRR